MKDEKNAVKFFETLLRRLHWWNCAGKHNRKRQASIIFPCVYL